MNQELTGKQIETQDCVDNAIYNLVNEIRPEGVKELEWDISWISDLREMIFNVILEESKVTDYTKMQELEMEYYPFIYTPGE